MTASSNPPNCAIGNWKCCWGARRVVEWGKRAGQAVDDRSSSTAVPLLFTELCRLCKQTWPRRSSCPVMPLPRRSGNTYLYQLTPPTFPPTLPSLLSYVCLSTGNKREVSGQQSLLSKCTFCQVKYNYSWLKLGGKWGGKGGVYKVLARHPALSTCQGGTVKKKTERKSRRRGESRSSLATWPAPASAQHKQTL